MDVCAALHSYLTERLRGHIAIDVRHPPPEEVLERARELMEEEDRRREREAVAKLEAGLGTGDQSVAGLAEGVAALNDGRVATLLVADGFSVPGAVVEAAQRESAEVLIIHGDGLDSHGSIGALLRY